jgi:hypothetical protein
MRVTPSLLSVAVLCLGISAASEPVSSEAAKAPLKCESVADLVNLVTVLSLKGNLQNSRGFIEGKYKLSPKLADLPKRYLVGECLTFSSPEALYGVWNDRVSAQPVEKEQWLGIPISCSKRQFPQFAFRKGELGLRLGESYATQGTEIRVEGNIYRYTGGRWEGARGAGSPEKRVAGKPGAEEQKKR